jgi:hypothetical protein
MLDDRVALELLEWDSAWLVRLWAWSRAILGKWLVRLPRLAWHVALRTYEIDEFICRKSPRCSAFLPGLRPHHTICV